jgi:probable HAF family extracellular repeat protein
MKQRFLILFAAMALATLWGLLPGYRVSAQTAVAVNSYTALEIGIYAYDVNDSGQVVGEADAAGAYHAILWQNGVTTDLGTLGGSSSGAQAINNHSQVVGYSALPGEAPSHAFLWDPTNGMQDLGTLGGDGSWTSDINDAGQVVGTAQNAAGSYHAFLWTNGQMTDLGVPDGFVDSYAYKINASGQVVGVITNASGEGWAFRWTPSGPNATNGTMVLLSPTAGSYAYAINGFGDIAGSVVSGDGYSLSPTLWDSGNGVHLLPVLNGGWDGIANAINDARLVAGYNTVPIDWDGYEFRAFVWDSSNGTRDLTVLAGQPVPYALDYAYSVNASGLILVSSGSGYSTYLLTPSPLSSRPLNLRASSNAGGTGVSLTWNASYGAATYKVKRATTSGGPYTTVATMSGTSWTDTTVASGNTYYVISAVNAYGESAHSDAAQFTPRPAPPTNLTATAGKTKGQRHVTLQWKQSVSPGVTQNRIYRSTTSGGGYSLRATVSAGTTFTDTGVANGVTYYYVVTAVNGSTGQAGSYSNQASAKVR